MKNIGWMLRQRATVSPRLQAYVEPSTDVRMTYAQMNALANRCADVLTALGIAKGDRVALLMPNSVEFCCLFYGAAKLGAVAVPINTRLAAPEVSFILSDSGSKVVIYGAPSAPVIDAIRAQADPPGTVTDWIGADSLAERLRSAAADEPAVECGGDDNLFIMYTSGTTGHPKGVVHTHESVHSAASSWASTIDVRYRDRLLLPLPMFHVAALTTVIFSAMRGVTLISMPQFDATKVWSLIVEERVCIGGAVPAILNFMRQVPEFAELDAPDFRYFITGGAPMPEALIKIYAAKNIEVVQGYALTESCGGGTLLLSEDALRKAGSAGRATMFTDVAVRGDDGVIREHGEGEVVIKSDILLKEYWNRPEATRDAFDNGWFRTGDIGEIDDEGYLYIKDRLKDHFRRRERLPGRDRKCDHRRSRGQRGGGHRLARREVGRDRRRHRRCRPERGQRAADRRVLRNQARTLQAAQEGDLRRGHPPQPDRQDPQNGAARTVFGDGAEVMHGPSR